MSSLRFFLVASSPVNPRISELMLYNEESEIKNQFFINQALLLSDIELEEQSYLDILQSVNQSVD